MIEHCSAITEGNYAIYNGWSILNNAANFLCIYKRWELCREKGWLSGWGPEWMCVVDIHTAVSKTIALCPEVYDKALCSSLWVNADSTEVIYSNFFFHTYIWDLKIPLLLILAKPASWIQPHSINHAFMFIYIQ